jgi:hypothetical protein
MMALQEHVSKQHDGNVSNAPSFKQRELWMGIATTTPWNKISVAEAATVTTTEPEQQAAV